MSTSINNLIGTFYEAASGKTELLDAVIADDWDDIPPGPGQEPGRAGARTLIEGLSKAFINFRFVVEEIIDARGEDGNGMVGVRARMHGVHTGEFFGIAPTGRQTEVRGRRPDADRRATVCTGGPRRTCGGIRRRAA
jgi:predicted ester cyclase